MFAAEQTLYTTGHAQLVNSHITSTSWPRPFHTYDTLGRLVLDEELAAFARADVDHVRQQGGDEYRFVLHVLLRVRTPEVPDLDFDRVHVDDLHRPSLAC